MSEIKNKNTAKAVIVAAKENDIWESAIPSDENQLLADANFILEQAEAAWNHNIRGAAVTAVKFAADVDGEHTGKDVEPDADDDEAIAVLKQTIPEIKKDVDLLVEKDLDAVQALLDAEQAGKARKGVISYIELQLQDAFKEPDEITSELESGDRGGDNGSGVISPWASGLGSAPDDTTEPPGGPAPDKSKLDDLFEAEAFAQAQAKKLNLPTPEAAVDDIPAATLSRGVANLTIQDLAERLTDASLCLAAATWQTALAEIDEEHAKRVGSHYFNKEYAKAAPNAKNKEAAVAKAEEAQEVRSWRDKEAEAENRYVTFRALKEIYKGTYDTISRVFAMRQEENDRRT